METNQTQVSPQIRMGAVATKQEVLAKAKEVYYKKILLDTPLVTSVRRVNSNREDNKIAFQLEYMEKRSLSAQNQDQNSVSLLYHYNKEFDDRFNKEVIFRSWLTLTSPEALQKVFGGLLLKKDFETLNKIEVGTDDRLVLFAPVTKITINNKEYQPHIIITEFIVDQFNEANLSNKQKDNIEENLENYLLQTGGNNTEYIVDSITGSRIVRLTEVRAVEIGKTIPDTLIPNKILESDFNGGKKVLDANQASTLINELL